MGHDPSSLALPLNTGRLLVDPLNRFYRYPQVRKLAVILKDSKITPNQITVAHAAVGVFAAYCIFKEHYFCAVLLYELRTILDALDGMLARLRDQASATGRILDTLADAITFNALMIVGALRLIQDFRNYNSSLIIFGVFLFALTTAHCGTVYQLMKRKLGSIIKQEVDLVETEWHENYAVVRAKNADLLNRIAFWIDSRTIHFVSAEWYRKILRRKDSPEWKELLVREAKIMNELACMSRKREFMKAVKATAFLSEDNIFSLLSFVFLVLCLFPGQIFPHVHPVLIAFSVGLVYALGALGVGLHYLQGFLHGVHRE